MLPGGCSRTGCVVLSLVRSVKNSFSPINRIPPDVFSSVAEYYDMDDEEEIDQAAITLTHVCRSWRDIFTSRSPLWTMLDFTNTDKARTCIQRSQSSPLKLHLGDDTKILEGAFALVMPHICRLGSLTIPARALPSTLVHFRRHAPLLERLHIDIAGAGGRSPALDDGLLNGDLSSLRELHLKGVITRLS